MTELNVKQKRDKEGVSTSRSLGKARKLSEEFYQASQVDNHPKRILTLRCHWCPYRELWSQNRRLNCLRSAKDTLWASRPKTESKVTEEINEKKMKTRVRFVRSWGKLERNSYHRLCVIVHITAINVLWIDFIRFNGVWGWSRSCGGNLHRCLI